MYPNPASDPLAALAPHKEMAMLTFFPSFAIQDSNLPLVVVDDMRRIPSGSSTIVGFLWSSTWHHLHRRVTAMRFRHWLVDTSIPLDYIGITLL